MKAQFADFEQVTKERIMQLVLDFLVECGAPGLVCAAHWIICWALERETTLFFSVRVRVDRAMCEFVELLL